MNAEWTRATLSTRGRRLLWRLGWPARAVLLAAIAVYRVSLGHVIGGGCRFYPSCSAYAQLAIRQNGAVRGAALAAWRILRCSPLSRGGVEYPPAGGAYEPIIHERVEAPS